MRKNCEKSMVTKKNTGVGVGVGLIIKTWIIWEWGCEKRKGAAAKQMCDIYNWSQSCSRI